MAGRSEATGREQGVLRERQRRAVLAELARRQLLLHLLPVGCLLPMLLCLSPHSPPCTSTASLCSGRPCRIRVARASPCASSPPSRSAAAVEPPHESLFIPRLTRLLYRVVLKLIPVVLGFLLVDGIIRDSGAGRLVPRRTGGVRGTESGVTGTGFGNP